MQGEFSSRLLSASNTALNLKVSFAIDLPKKQALRATWSRKSLANRVTVLCFLGPSFRQRI